MAKVSEAELTDFVPDPDNANLGTERGQAMIEDSIREDGAARSIVIDADNVIVAGSKTHQGAIDAGLEKAVIVEVRGDELVVVKRTDFNLDDDDGRARRYAYRDNRSGELNLTWDVEQLLTDLNADVDLSGLFTDIELEAILGEAWVEAGEVPEAKINKGAELAEKYGVEAGQIWQLGEHRLACGDCTDTVVVDAVMQGEKTKYGFHDPPYGTDTDTAWLSALNVKRGKPPNISDDKLVGDDGTLDTSVAFASPRWMVWGFPYIAHPEMTGWLVWDKWPGIEDGSGLGNPVEMACTNLWKGFRIIRVMWGGYYRDAGEKRESHPTQKPLGVIQPFIEQYTEIGDVIADYFVGSGTTLIACEQLGRKCRAIEVKPAYVAVTLDRAERMGLEPKLLE